MQRLALRAISKGSIRLRRCRGIKIQRVVVSQDKWGLLFCWSLLHIWYCFHRFCTCKDVLIQVQQCMMGDHFTVGRCSSDICRISGVIGSVEAALLQQMVPFNMHGWRANLALMSLFSYLFPKFHHWKPRKVLWGLLINQDPKKMHTTVAARYHNSFQTRWSAG